MAREMKETGLKWLGQIPKDWNLVRIGSQYTERRTKVSDTEYAPLSVTMKGILPQLSTAAKTDAHDDRKLVCKGDFAINSRSDRRGSCGISPMDGSVSLINTILTPREEMDPQYYDWLFHSTMFSDEYYSWGHGIVDDLWTTGWQDMKKIMIPEPSLEEQARIAAFLDHKCAEIDSVIASTQRTIEEYKVLKQSIITEAVTKGVRGKRPMKDSGIEWIGEIPQNWERSVIKRVAETCSGGTPTSSDESLYDGNINWVCSYDLHEKPIHESGRKITEAGAKSIAGKLQEKGAVLLAMYGGAGTIGNSGILECEARTNQAICSVKFNDKYVLDYYGFYFIMAIRQYWMIYAVGTRKDPNISQDIVKRMPFILPPLSEQEEIIEYLNVKCAEIDRLSSSKQELLLELESFKRSLIYEYVTGKKEVPACQ